MYSGIVGRFVAVLAVLVGLAAVAPTYGWHEQRDQQKKIQKRGRESQVDRHPRRRAAEPQPVPSALERDFGFPDPDRPWGGARFLDPYYYRNRQRLRSYRYGYSPGYYYDDFTYRYGVPYQDDPYRDSLERAYRQGIEDGRNFERFEVQAERGLASYQEAMSAGYAAFSSGKYGAAVRSFLLAATLHQGDPASRLCAAHAQMALGHYEPASGLIRRAFELQPRLVYLPIDLRSVYGDAGEFRQHLGALRNAANRSADNAELWFLLGYCLYYSNNVKGATNALDHAAMIQPGDKLIASLADTARTTLRRRHPIRHSRPGDGGF